MKLLKKSANRLMTLLETCVTDIDIDRSKDGAVKTDTFRLEMAVKCANSLATQLQTQANIVKAVSQFMKAVK